MQSVSLTRNDELSDQMTVSAKISQSVNMPPWGDRDTSILSMIYLAITEHLIPPGNVFIRFGATDRTHCCMQMTVEPMKVPEVSLFLWVWFF